MRKIVFSLFGIFGLTMIVPEIAEATIIAPPPANLWIGLLKLGIVVLIVIGLVSGLVYSVLKKTRRNKHNRENTEFSIYYFKGLVVLLLLSVLGMVLIYLGRYVFGEDNWFYRWQVISRFCTGSYCL